MIEDERETCKICLSCQFVFDGSHLQKFITFIFLVRFLLKIVLTCFSDCNTSIKTNLIIRVDFPLCIINKAAMKLCGNNYITRSCN